MAINVVPTRDIVEKAMITLSIKFPQFALLISRIGYQVVESNKSACAWTDGTSITINSKAIDSFNKNPIRTINNQQVNCTIGKEEMAAILCHELFHLIGQTFTRGELLGIRHNDLINKENRKKFQRWNIATDYEINSLIVNNGETSDFSGSVERKPLGKLPPFALYESKYSTLTAEEIYHQLEEQDDQPQGHSEGVDELGFDNEDLSDYDMDEHLPLLDDETRNEIVAKVSEILGGKSYSSGQSSLDRILNVAYKPKPFNWRRALVQYIRSWIRNNYTWNKHSRAGAANKLILPSAYKTPKLHVACAIDTSGSVSNTQLKEIIEYLFGILKQFKQYEVDVWCCSTEVHAETFRKYTPVNAKDFTELPIKSYGGTDLRKNFDFIEKKYKAKLPDVFILLSDFEDSMSGDTTLTYPGNCIWMVYDNKRFVPPKNIKAVTYYLDTF